MIVIMYIILRPFETGLRETFGLIARPLPCDPDLHRTLTYFFSKTNEKGPMFVERLCFFSNYVGLPIFQNFRNKFFYPIFYQFSPRFGIFLWGMVEMRPIWAAHPRIISYICEVTPPAPTPPPFKGAPK